MAILSIIIPVYNVEKYLRDTLESIVNQNGFSECELLLVNDGSTDSSLSILKEYENRFGNIRVFDKPNEGVSATRNFGIGKASGDYIFFVDADDLLHPNALDIILSGIRNGNPDMLIWRYDTFYTHPKFASDISAKDIKHPECQIKEAFNYFMRIGTAVSLCTKAIRRNIIGDDIRLDSTMTYGEDMFFSWKAISLAQTINFIDAPLYYYRQTGCSAVSKFHPALYEKYSKAFCDFESFATTKGFMTEELSRDIDYHFARRIPALATMESRAPYSKKKKLERLSIILNDARIRRALSNDKRLNNGIDILAREGNLKGLLFSIKMDSMKNKILTPLKRLLK